MVSNTFFLTLFNLDSLAFVMIGLIGFIGLTVASFSTRYLVGDSHYKKFFVLLFLLIASLVTLVCADHLALFFTTWVMSNLFLVKLMIYKSQWRAAKASGDLTLKTFSIGFGSMLVAFIMIYATTGLTSIQAITHSQEHFPAMVMALLLILIAAMVQSAIWPFHRWLTSSLNSPTPVSAIMHAGLVNGGGLLLVRFGPLYSQMPELLTLIFVIGMTSAMLGTLWKLLQTDVKRMLACSTMGQMGFMLAQIGLGLFPAAIAHLYWHGMFKAYLFLASGSAAQEKRLDLGYPPSIISFLAALVSGLMGGACFMLAAHLDPFILDTTLIQILLAFLVTSQLALPIVHERPIRRLTLALVATGGMGGLYGASFYFVEIVLAPLNLMHPQPLNLFHWLGMILLVGSWLALLFGKNAIRNKGIQSSIQRLYVKALNASQPLPETITVHRKDYRYK